MTPSTGGGVLTTALNATNVARWQLTNLGATPILLPWQVVVYDPDMLTATNIGFPENTPAPGNFADWRSQNHVFTDMAAVRSTKGNLTGNDGAAPQGLSGHAVTANYFRLLGVQPTIGRTFTDDEDKPGNRVVVLSDRLWR